MSTLRERFSSHSLHHIRRYNDSLTQAQDSSAPRKSHLKAPPSTPPKFCSDKCRARKPRYPSIGLPPYDSSDTLGSLASSLDPRTWSLEARIEATFVDLLDGAHGGARKTKAQGSKGDGRRLVMCQEVEDVIFGGSDGELLPRDGTQSQTPKKKKRGLPDDRVSDQILESRDLDRREADDYARAEEVAGVPIYLDRTTETNHPGTSNLNKAGNSNTLPPTETDLQRRRAGQEKADQRELVRQAGRRGVAFGFWDPRRSLGSKGSGDKGSRFEKETGRKGEEEDARRKVEIVQRGKVLEGSFAKGEWGVRLVD